jgi:Cu-Zn family superoxide dismutase
LARVRAPHLAAAAILAAGVTIAAVAITSNAGAQKGEARATLYSTSGAKVGKVTFDIGDHHTDVRVTLAGVPGIDAFHGFHIHANNDPANGVGCVAAGGFASADGHWRAGGELHGAHRGDLPSVYVNPDGIVEAKFTMDRMAVADLDGKAIILHAGRDNFNNVPVGAAGDQYQANSQAALDATAATGNAGARIACGVIG